MTITIFPDIFLEQFEDYEDFLWTGEHSSQSYDISSDCPQANYCLTLLLAAGAKFKNFKNEEQKATGRTKSAENLQKEQQRDQQYFHHLYRTQGFTGVDDLCLKHACRLTIRDHVMDLHPESNLFVTVQHLPLPTILKEYLVFDVDVTKPWEECHTDTDEDTHAE